MHLKKDLENRILKLTINRIILIACISKVISINSSKIYHLSRKISIKIKKKTKRNQQIMGFLLQGQIVLINKIINKINLKMIRKKYAQIMRHHQ